MKKNILLIGGTGVVGSATALVALEHGFNVYTISLEKNNDLPENIHQYICDRNDRMAFRSLIRELNAKAKIWDIVFDIIGSRQRDAEQTCFLLGGITRRIFFLSTTLVYSREKYTKSPIPSSFPLASKGEMGGYVDSKVAMEEFIRDRKNISWTLLRPYHILGRYSLLGCLPDHNRDPHLVKRLKMNNIITLCNFGAIPLQIVHPKDIARVIVLAAQSKKTLHRVYNIVNPTVITAKEYYEEVARQLDVKLRIKSKDLKRVWNEQGGWELTTFPHVYDISDLQKDISFTPALSLKEAVFDALHSPKKEYEVVADIPVHNRMTLLPRPKRIFWLFDQ